jgi:transcriptional regulator with GAF, ATPase, and Fis domain
VTKADGPVCDSHTRPGDTGLRFRPAGGNTLGPVSPDKLPLVLGRIARSVAGSLDLKEVVARVAEATAEVLPFDAFLVIRTDAAQAFVLHSFVGESVHPPAKLTLDDFSPAMREYFPRFGVIDDLDRILDPAYALDRRMRDDGLKSALVIPIQRAGRLDAILSVGSRRAHAYDDDHEASLRLIADLVGLALEHERLWTLDVSRRRRLDAVDALLPTLQQALDVRAIFNQVSAVVKPVLHHDRLVLTSLAPDMKTVTIDALSGEPVPDLTRTADIPSECAARMTQPEVVADVETEPQPGDRRERARLLGIRSLLRCPLRMVDGRAGSLLFLAKQPGAYTDDDMVVAHRVADYVSLALSHQRLAEEARVAEEARNRADRLEQRVERLREELATSRGYRRVVGDSKAWSEVLTQAAKVAPTETTVLLTGESGTGKEVIARLIHRGSSRGKGPFVALNCAALPETLLESELFGHEKGAFTGATASRAGCIEQASGGVLFLDEVGEMSRAVQAKLLRVLQEREYQPLGASKTVKADVRVVAATNRDLAAAMSRGEFREDLYYRLQVFEIRLPPLRDRMGDVLPLAESFLDELGNVVGRPAAGISRDAREVLLGYAWPGNVRELRNVLERATILCDGGLITAEHLPRELGQKTIGAPGRAAPTAASTVNLEAVEREAVIRALELSGNNRSQAARLLGIARPQLYHRLKKFGIDSGGATPADVPTD